MTSSPPPSPPLWAAILAGGRGTRFWPLSRRNLPKQCLSLDGGPTMLQRTLLRLDPLIPRERVLVITGPDMEAPVRDQLADLPPENILVEPSSRNTAPVVAWSAWEVQRRGGGVVAVLPSDHHIGDEPRFRQDLADGAAVAAQGGLVTLGIHPTRPETGFGWIEPDGTPDPAAPGPGRALPVRRFVEKPPLAEAERMLDSGRFLWNAGMFLWRSDVVLDAVHTWLPGTTAGLAALDAGAPIRDAWPRMEATSVDYGILEHARDIRVLPVDFGWSDVGSWPALADVLPVEEWGSGVAETVVASSSRANLVHAPGKLVALLGVEGLILVDTPDAVLVARREDAQAVKTLLDAVESRHPGRYS